METLVIPLVLVLMQAVKQAPPFAHDPATGDRKNAWLLPWIAAALGIGTTLLCSQVRESGWDIWQQIFYGLIFGMAAAGLWDGGINQIVKRAAPSLLIISILALVAAGGCSTAARHEYITEAVTLALMNQDQVAVAGREFLGGVEAKALQDESRLDDALMLKMLEVAKIGGDDAALKAAILDTMQRYKGYLSIVHADVGAARAREAKLQAIIDATREALAGVLAVEARSQANMATREALVDRAVAGELWRTLRKGVGP